MATKDTKSGPKAPSPRQMCEAFGEEALISAIKDGKMLAEIAAEIGVVRGTLSNWIAADPSRSARAREARADAAAAYDEMAYENINSATDTFSLAKAREQAQHLRWRASKVNPKDYGERQTLDHQGSVAMTLFDGEQARRMAEQLINAPK